MTGAEDFDAEADCNTLHEAMQGRGTNEDDIIQILANRDTIQRQILKVKYQEMFDDDLVFKLKRELRGELEDCVVAVMDVSLIKFPSLKVK